MQQRPGRTILTMLSIVIGVTASMAVGLGTATTRNAYKQMFAMVTGKATLEVSSAGGGSFDDEVFPKVEGIEGVVAATPLIDRPTSMSRQDGEGRVRLEILGIDPTRDTAVRDYDISAGRLVKAGDEIVVEEGFAGYLGLKLGDEVRLLTRRLSKPFLIVGLLKPASGVAMTQTAIALMPIERAKYHFNSSDASKRNLIDRIQVVTAPNADVEQVEKRIQAVLPKEVEVHRPAVNTQLMQQTLLSSEQGLGVTTRFSVLMALIIILNTFFMNVSERRRHLSIMRAIGATRSQIRWSLLIEALILGVIGTALGIVCGVVVAFVGTQLVGRAFDVQLPRLVEVMTPGPFINSAVFGLITALIGAYLPALLAGRVSPLEGMNRVVSGRSRSFTWIFLVGGLVLTIVSCTVILSSLYGVVTLDMAANFGPLLLVGLVMLNGAFLAPAARVFAAFVGMFFRVESALALKQVLRNHVRSALTVGVLFIAGSTGVGIASSILDCVRDVHDWVSQALVADYFVRAMLPDMAKGTAADLPEGLGEELKTVPHIRSMDGASFVEASVPQPGDAEPVSVIVLARSFNEKQPAFDLISGDRPQLREQLRSGQIVVGSVLAQKLKLAVGDKLPMQTDQGVQDATICGIANEYLVGGLAVHMVRDQAIQWFGIQGVDGYAINAEEGYREAIRPELERICKKYDVFVMSQGDIRNRIDRIVAGTEWSLWLLIYTGFVVAGFGVANTLTMNVLEQTRELGLLRIVAMTKSQVKRTIQAQALIIGGVGLPPGIAVGVIIAYVLNLAMMPAFGHPIEFNLNPKLLLATGLGAIVIVMLAAFIPARRAAGINVVEALHYE